MLKSSVPVRLLLLALFPPTCGSFLCAAFVLHESVVKAQKSLWMTRGSAALPCRVLSPTFTQARVRPARRTPAPTWACASSSGRTSHATAPWRPTPARTATTVSTTDFVLHDEHAADSVLWLAHFKRHGQIPVIQVESWDVFGSVAAQWLYVTVFYSKAQTWEQMFHTSPPAYMT